MRTSDRLVEYCMLDMLPEDFPVLVDFFGVMWNDGSEDDLCTILGLYQGLVKQRGVTADDLHDACLGDKVEELIHRVYKDNETGYYVKFCESGIKLNPPYSYIIALLP